MHISIMQKDFAKSYDVIWWRSTHNTYAEHRLRLGLYNDTMVEHAF